MLIEQIDAIGSQALEAGLRDGLDVLGPAICSSAAFAGLEVDVEAELGGDDHLVANRFERLANKLLIDERAVGFGRVEQCHAAVEGRADELDHLLLVGGRAVEGAHAHAAEAKSGNFEIWPIFSFSLLILLDPMKSASTSRREPVRCAG